MRALIVDDSRAMRLVIGRIMTDLGFETADICKEVGITPTHCWVLLYRARMALRECLGKGGFGR